MGIRTFFGLAAPRPAREQNIPRSSIESWPDPPARLGLRRRARHTLPLLDRHSRSCGAQRAEDFEIGWRNFSRQTTPLHIGSHIGSQIVSPRLFNRLSNI